MGTEMRKWLRFRHAGATGFGTLTSDGISVHEGEMFGRNADTGKILALSEVELLAPCVPSKIVALWNNFHALAAKLKQPEPPEPLYLLKATTTITTPGAVIRRPSYYDGKTTYEGELGIVIGKTCTEVSPEEANDFALLHLEVQVVDRGDARVSFGQVFDFDHGEIKIQRAVSVTDCTCWIACPRMRRTTPTEKSTTEPVSIGASSSSICLEDVTG